MPQAERGAPRADAHGVPAPTRQHRRTRKTDPTHTTGTGLAPPAHTDADPIRTDLGGHTDTNVHATRTSRTAHADTDDNTHVTRAARTTRRTRRTRTTCRTSKAQTGTDTHSTHTHTLTSPTHRATPRKGPA
ncbi:hypothetical protein HLK59_47655 [Streptomyces sp. S3(2020)]|uniref:hypothetical protein n=1 Tax=Streptomyces sp. S3(2020) TaxID=2732044 RepID=UPI001488DCEE|nr:hypothetical protein [Streptomyces sp. S3(2020)]NNN37868.1 hypothetical protein [Streptomyces sp. S3(2020)]